MFYGKKVILYGLGQAFIENRETLEKYFNVVGYTDKDHMRCATYGGVPREDLSSYGEYDYIYVTAIEYYKEIKNDLINEFHIPEEKIINELDILKADIEGHGRNMKTRFGNVCYEIIKHRAGMENIYQTQYDKRCLISYITYPFQKRSDSCAADCMHTNALCAVNMAQVLKKLGYNVDVADYREQADYELYDIILGFGNYLEQFLANKPEGCKTKVILFLTGASTYFSNFAELKRLNYFNKRNPDASLRLPRQVTTTVDLNTFQNAFGIICTGNRWTVSTYENMASDIYTITPIGFDNLQLLSVKRNMQTAKNNFFYFGGGGMLHKGLDLCIEAFRNNDNLHLYIASPKDEDLYAFYAEDFKRPNIHYCGYINVNSDLYREICEKCLFSLSPSCSEGMSTSVLTTMFSGMIPIVTQETGIDIGDWGFELENVDIDYLTDFINSVSRMSDKALEYREKKTYTYVMENHRSANFSESLERILKKLLSE